VAPLEKKLKRSLKRVLAGSQRGKTQCYILAGDLSKNMISQKIDPKMEANHRALIWTVSMPKIIKRNWQGGNFCPSSNNDGGHNYVHQKLQPILL